MPFLGERTYRSDTATDFHARMCLLGIFYIAPHLGGQKPQNPQFWGVNRRFQAKLAKSKNVHIFKTTASIPTKFCTVIKTTKCLRGWSPYTHYKSKMAGGRHLGKIEKSSYFGRGSTDFHEIWHAGAFRPH